MGHTIPNIFALHIFHFGILIIFLSNFIFSGRGCCMIISFMDSMCHYQSLIQADIVSTIHGTLQGVAVILSVYLCSRFTFIAGFFSFHSHLIAIIMYHDIIPSHHYTSLYSNRYELPEPSSSCSPVSLIFPSYGKQVLSRWQSS